MYRSECETTPSEWLRATPVPGPPRPPQGLEFRSPAKPTVKRRVPVHRQIARDQSPAARASPLPVRVDHDADAKPDLGRAVGPSLLLPEEPDPLHILR